MIHSIKKHCSAILSHIFISWKPKIKLVKLNYFHGSCPKYRFHIQELTIDILPEPKFSHFLIFLTDEADFLSTYVFTAPHSFLREHSSFGCEWDRERATQLPFSSCHFQSQLKCSFTFTQPAECNTCCTDTSTDHRHLIQRTFFAVGLIRCYLQVGIYHPDSICKNIQYSYL